MDLNLDELDPLLHFRLCDEIDWNTNTRSNNFTLIGFRTLEELNVFESPKFSLWYWSVSQPHGETEFKMTKMKLYWSKLKKYVIFNVISQCVLCVLTLLAARFMDSNAIAGQCLGRNIVYGTTQTIETKLWPGETEFHMFILLFRLSLVTLIKSLIAYLSSIMPYHSSMIAFFNVWHEMYFIDSKSVDALFECLRKMSWVINKCFYPSKIACLLSYE